jgi:hypothetical protein
MSASTHLSYLEQLGIAGRPLASSIVPSRRRRGQLGHRGAKTIAVITEGDLFKLRGQIFWLFATDEERDGKSVLIKRGLAVVARLQCAIEALTWDAERICAGIRFRRGAE